MIKVELLVPIMEEAFSKNQTFSFPIHGTSMLPLLKDNTLVELKQMPEYHKNDIIFYKRNDGSFVLHRIVKEKNNAFVLMGDHQYIKEYPIYQNQIYGKVISYQKNSKTKYLKGFKYNFYLFLLKFYLFRRFNGSRFGAK